MKTENLSTPCLLIDRRRLEANLGAMQQIAMENGVGLRPHTKTHKSIDLARMQLDLGATGLTVAKTGEAEVFVEAGFEDVRIAYTVIGNDKYARIVRLMEKARVSFCVDTIEGARLASAFFSERDITAQVLIEVDTGYGRCGVRWDDVESVRFVDHVSKLPGLDVVGILTHAGHAYRGPESDGISKKEALVQSASMERDSMLAFATKLAEAGLIEDKESFEISIGSTPSTTFFENAELDGFRITEIRPGSYVFHDRIHVDLGLADWTQCALSVMTTVVSHHRNADGSERLFLDAGKKVFTSDTVSGLE
ncbi:MAG: D-TA family PLP-dependent enzyme, partial [Rhodothermales bacterium]|nr:D-TA family PLP-dependent enzyme [Rhodothermales bacterium]